MNRVHPRLLVATQGLPEFEPTVGPAFVFERCFDAVWDQWFDDLLPSWRPTFRWAKDPGRKRQLKTMRVAGYFPDTGEVLLHPRVARPWVARVFIEHCFHHEFCHVRQEAEPLPMERSHSDRFLEWEKEFPGYARATRWELANIGGLLRPAEGFERW